MGPDLPDTAENISIFNIANAKKSYIQINLRCLLSWLELLLGQNLGICLIANLILELQDSKWQIQYGALSGLLCEIELYD